MGDYSPSKERSMAKCYRESRITLYVGIPGASFLARISSHNEDVMLNFRVQNLRDLLAALKKKE